MTRAEKNLSDIRQRGTALAEKIVLRDGLKALSARGLAKELGVSVGTLYNAFGDLDAVINAVNLRSGALLSERLHAAVDAAAPDPKSRLVALGYAYFDFATEEPERWAMLFEHKAEISADEVVETHQRDLMELLIRSAGVDPDEEERPERFVMLWASVHGLVSLANRPSIIAVPREAARQYIVDLVDTGLLMLRVTRS